MAATEADDHWKADPLAVLDAAVAGLGGERRGGQHELAAAVTDAMRAGHHLVAEAPTGSGKSLAYLAPAVASGLRVIVATSTIALQSQLVDNDLPLLAEHGGVPFTFALLKGRSNYVCRAKLSAAGRPDALFDAPVGAAFDTQVQALEKFAAGSETGDRGELKAAISDAAWAAVSCAPSECPGRTNCNDGPTCFAERARDRAREASVLVVNHALYCTHLASGVNVLPEHDVVIIDEAHAFADNATNAFSADLSPDVLGNLASMLTRSGLKAVDADRLRRTGTALGAAIEGIDGAVDISEPKLNAALVGAAELLAGALKQVGRAESDDEKRTVQVVNGRLEVLRRLAAPLPDDVVWVERIRRNERLRIAPVAVDDALGSRMLERQPVIAVSATLGGTPPFRQYASAAGFQPDADPGSWGEPDEAGNRVSATGRGYVALRAPSSFDWREQGRLYVAKDLPDPRNDAWLDAASARLVKLVNAAGGRTLVLCTSHKNVERFTEVLRAETEFEILAQREADVARLTQSFVATETSVLVGTRSFWAGIDAPGVSCVLVVIDKIPFPMFGDPLWAARRTRAGANAFTTVDLPAAALVLAQGSGRLLRRVEDRGVVAVLDRRLAEMGYRRELLAAVPPLRRSVDLDEICEFLGTTAS